MELEVERNQSSELRSALTPQIFKLVFPHISFDRIKELMEIGEKYSALQSCAEMHYETRPQLIERALKQSLAIRDISQSHNLTPDERYFLFSFHPEMTNAAYHYAFFKSVFDVQASEEQRAKYNRQIESMEIVGCFAQTEMKHGSYVRGIETRATYDAESDGFIINSPSISSLKWWIGALGVGANYALLVARMIIEENDYGPHAFFVQIRDLNTHRPLPGVLLGDIGPKVGLNGNDNGFLKFEFVRVPREALLNRFANVKKGGEYEIIDPNGIKVLYYSLLKARINIVREVWLFIMACQTIATRYSILRKQFPNPNKQPQELQIIDYQIQQHKLFISLAFGYATVFACNSVQRMFNECEGNVGLMDDLHGIVSVYKSLITDRAVAVIETLRRSCGGHGYLTSSGFQQFLTNSVATCTYDGDNSIMSLQLAKYMLKQKLKASKGIELRGRYQVLTRKPSILSAFTDAGSVDFHVACFSAIVHEMTEQCFRTYQKLLELKTPGHRIWNSLLQIEGIKISTAFFVYSLHTDYIEGIQQIQGHQPQEAVELLRKIFAINELLKYDALLLDLGVSPQMIGKLNIVLEKTLKKVRPIALGLAEAFEIKECTLNSSIGRRDGKMYEEMIWQAKYLNPLNKHRVFPGIHKYLRPKL